MPHRTRHLQRHPGFAPARWRSVAAMLLVAFALGQGLALSHMGGALHDHEGPCAACRLLGESASAIAPAPACGPERPLVGEFVPATPVLDRSSERLGSHAPRAPPLA